MLNIDDIDMEIYTKLDCVECEESNCSIEKEEINVDTLDNNIKAMVVEDYIQIYESLDTALCVANQPSLTLEDLKNMSAYELLILLSPLPIDFKYFGVHE